MLSIQQNQPNLSFKAGLNKGVVQLQHTFDCKNAEKFLNSQGIVSNFQNNRAIALSVNIAVNILNYLNCAFNMFKFRSPSINVYSKEKLLLNSNLYHFCIPENKKVLINESEFKPASIFYSNVPSVEELDFQAEQAKKQGLKNTNHFLSDIIHEMMHAIYLNKIYEKYGSKSFDILKGLERKTLNERENEIVGNVLGEYATKPLNQYHEVFADTFTKSICDSLSATDILPKENPLNLFREYPKEFIDIIKKVLNV